MASIVNAVVMSGSVDLDEVVAVDLFACESEVGRAAVHDGVLAVESADNELVVDLVTAPDSGDLQERWRQFR